MTENADAVPTVFATRSFSAVPMRVQIPKGLVPGDSFTVTPGTGGKVFSAIVPAGAAPGSFIDIVIPDESDEEDDDDAASLRSCSPSLTKTNVGAALAGGLLGTLLMGPIVGVILAGGAAYATTRGESSVGQHARSIGDFTFRNASLAKKWTEAEAKKLYNRTDTPPATFPRP